MSCPSDGDDIDVAVIIEVAGCQILHGDLARFEQGSLPLPFVESRSIVDANA